MENRVVGPAVSLIIVAALDGLYRLLNLVLLVFGIGMGGVFSFIESMPEQFGERGLLPMSMVTGFVGIIMEILHIAIVGFIIYAALKMKNLENYNFAKIAAILACIPCFTTPCCILGIPFGIWSLVVLLNPDIKACFKS